MKYLFADKGMVVAQLVCLAFIAYAIVHPDNAVTEKSERFTPAQAGIASEHAYGSREYSAFSDDSSEEADRHTFDGYDCTTDCSGHEAGYNWAEAHDITDGDDCDAAGDHSNSPSFAEGCHAYVDGDSLDDNTDDDNGTVPDEDPEP